MARGPTPRGSKKLAPPANDKQPPLPGKEWHEETLVWWRALGNAPEASQYTETDWLQLRLVARLMDAFIREPSRQLLAELRLQLAKYGLTPEDRARLRWEREKPLTGDTTKPTSPSRARPDPRLNKAA